MIGLFGHHGLVAARRAWRRDNRHREYAWRGCSLVDSGIPGSGRTSNAVACRAARRVGPSAGLQRCRDCGLRTALGTRAGHSRIRSSIGRVGRHDFSWRCRLCVRPCRGEGRSSLATGHRHGTDQQCRCQAGCFQPGAHSRPPMECERKILATRSHNSNVGCWGHPADTPSTTPISDDPLVSGAAVTA